MLGRVAGLRRASIEGSQGRKETLEESQHLNELENGGEIEAVLVFLSRNRSTDTEARAEREAREEDASMKHRMLLNAQQV